MRGRPKRMLAAAAIAAAAAGSVRAADSLLESAKAGNRAAAIAALSRSADPNLADADGTTPLIWAVHNDDVELDISCVLVDGRKTPTEPMRLIGRDDDYGKIGHGCVCGTGCVSVTLARALSGGAS